MHFEAIHIPVWLMSNVRTARDWIAFARKLFAPVAIIEHIFLSMIENSILHTLRTACLAINISMI